MTTKENTISRYNGDELHYLCPTCNGARSINRQKCASCHGYGFDLDRPIAHEHFCDENYRNLFSTMRERIELEWSGAASLFPVPSAPFEDEGEDDDDYLPF